MMCFHKSSVMIFLMVQRLHDAVKRMPDGYATIVGERGLKVSSIYKCRRNLRATLFVHSL